MIHSMSRPKMPPFALISSKAKTSASIRDFSLCAIEPVCECRSPTRIGRRAKPFSSAQIEERRDSREPDRDDRRSFHQSQLSLSRSIQAR